MLSTDEKNSPIWQKLKEEFSRRLIQLREENDRPLTEVETAKVRGRIAELKRIVSLGDLKDAIEIE